MVGYIQIEWMAASQEEARHIVKILLEKKLIACANLMANIESHYVWKGVLEQASEVKVILKSHQQHFAAVEKIIADQGSYEVPAITAYVIEKGNKSYLEWLKTSLNIHA
jgi:periplasmic divalent cation tolerance protein